MIGDGDFTFVKKGIPFFGSWAASIRMRPDGFSTPGIPKQPLSAKSCCARVSSPLLYERGGHSYAGVSSSRTFARHTSDEYIERADELARRQLVSVPDITCFHP